MTLDPVIAWSIRLSLGALWLSAAWHKLSDIRRFEATVRAHALLPSRVEPAFSRLLPLAEIVLASMMLGVGNVRPAAVATAVLLAVYALALALNLARGRRHIDCGCFGSSDVPLGPALVLRNGGLIVASLALLVPIESRSLVWIDGFTLGATLVIVALLWAATQHLARTGPDLRRWRGAR